MAAFMIVGLIPGLGLRASVNNIREVAVNVETWILNIGAQEPNSNPLILARDLQRHLVQTFELPIEVRAIDHDTGVDADEFSEKIMLALNVPDVSYHEV